MTDQNPNRPYSLPGATTLGLGAILGGGILALAGVAFEAAGPSALLAFLLNGGIAFLTAMSFAETSTTFPENGGAYRFTRNILSVRAAFCMGWILFFASLAASALYAIAFASYFLEGLETVFGYVGLSGNWLSGHTPRLILALASIGGYTLVLTRKQDRTGTLETAGKILLFLLILLGGFWKLSGTSGETITRSLEPFFPGGPYGVITAMGYTFITMQGFDLITSVGGEVEDPERNLPRSMFYTLLVTQLIYLPLLFILITVGTPEGTGISGLSREHTDVLVAVAVQEFLGTPGYWLIIVAAVLSMLSALYVNLLAASRIVHTMATDRTLPEYFESVDEESGIPVRAVLGTSCFLVVLLLVLPDLKSAGAAASLIFLISFALTHGLSILLRKRERGNKEAYRTPFFPLVPVTGGSLCLGLAVFQGFVEPKAGIIVLVWLSIGLLYFSIQLSQRARVTDAREEVMDTDLIPLRGRNPLVLIPVANPYNVRSMIKLGDMIAHPGVGRVLLLSVISKALNNSSNRRSLSEVENVLSEGLKGTLETSAQPRLLVTYSREPWEEIARVAREQNCESLLLGVEDLGKESRSGGFESIHRKLDCDVILLKATPNWDPSNANRILVPLAGNSGHDTLRARLLSSLCREGCGEITYIRIVPEDTPDREYTRIQNWLRQRGRDETPTEPQTVVRRSDDPTEELCSAASGTDLVVLGVNRSPHEPLLGETTRKLGQSNEWSTILINHLQEKNNWKTGQSSS